MRKTLGTQSGKEKATSGDRRSLTKFAVLSIVAALFTIGLKGTAWLITGSVGLFSDAAESLVNLVAAVVALVVLIVSSRPADKEHPYGHSKAEYFSAVAEGTMIFAAAAVIIVSAALRFRNLQPLEDLGVGLALSVVASIINGAVAVVLMRTGVKHRSITLQADGKHLMTDVWTTAGVLVAVLLVWVTGWLWLDPLIAIVVGLNILWAGWKLLRESINGLMDGALEPEHWQIVQRIVDEHRSDDVDFHAVRGRVSGSHSFVEMHVLVPGDWTVKKGHDLADALENEIMAEIPDVDVNTHVEPREDPLSYQDMLPIDELVEAAQVPDVQPVGPEGDG